MRVTSNSTVWNITTHQQTLGHLQHPGPLVAAVCVCQVAVCCMWLVEWAMLECCLTLESILTPWQAHGTVLSKDLKKVATLVKHLLENSVWNNFPLVIPLLPFRINWLQTKFLGFNFHRWLLNIPLLCNNWLPDCFISDQNLPYAAMQACSLIFKQKILCKDIWLLVTEIWVSMFLETHALFCWKCMKCMLE